MGLIKEPLNVDFVVEPKLLTPEESAAISKFIRDYKASHPIKKGNSKKTKRPSRLKTKELA